MAIRIARVQRLSGAYSARYIAAPILIGMEIMAVPNVKKKVPTIAGNIPPACIPSLGKLVKNSHEIADIPCMKM